MAALRYAPTILLAAAEAGVPGCTILNMGNVLLLEIDQIRDQLWDIHFILHRSNPSPSVRAEIDHALRRAELRVFQCLKLMQRPHLFSSLSDPALKDARGDEKALWLALNSLSYSAEQEGSIDPRVMELLGKIRSALAEWTSLLAFAKVASSPYDINKLLHADPLVIGVANPHHAPEDPAAQPRTADAVSVAVYVDGKNERGLKDVLKCVDDLVDALGYEGPFDETVEYGSIFRRYKAIIRKGAQSKEVQDRITKIERALELRYLDSQQADSDLKLATAVSNLTASFESVSKVCVRVGSILFIKYVCDRAPVVLVRNLSQIEIAALERYPEIQREPEKVLGALALAITEADSLPNV